MSKFRLFLETIWSDDPEWKAWLTRKMKTASQKDQAVIAILQKVVPGSAIVPDGTNDRAPKLLSTKGQLWTTVAKKLDRGDHACHKNCCDLWNSKTYPGVEYRIATGYYLNDKSERVWRSHSWLVRLSDNSVIETTDNTATHYYGVMLNTADCKDFAQHGGVL